MEFLQTQQYLADFRLLLDAATSAQSAKTRCLREALAHYTTDFSQLYLHNARENSTRARTLRKKFDAYFTNFRPAYAHWQQQGHDFNFFKFAFRKPRETDCTYILSKFLDSRAEHGQGSAFFSGFLELIEEEYWSAKKKPSLPQHYSVETEVVAKNGKSRFDIVIKGYDFILIVEAKIYSNEHGEQLKRYQSFAERARWKNYALIFLTIRGESSKDVENAKSISWKEVGRTLQKVLCSLDLVPEYAPIRLTCRDFCNYITTL